MSFENILVMKKLILIAFCSMFYAVNVHGQTQSPTKEHYDKIYDYYSPDNVDYNYCYLVGNGLSWTLSGLLRMYQATGDKAYLVKFINHCIHIQAVRKDEVSSVDPVAAWVGTGVNDPNDFRCYENNIDAGVEPVYFNSLLIFPMAEFINMVMHDQTLFNTLLPIQ